VVLIGLKAIAGRLQIGFASATAPAPRRLARGGVNMREQSGSLRRAIADGNARIRPLTVASSQRPIRIHPIGLLAVIL
jgi:hypothetical protein